MNGVAYRPDCHLLSICILFLLFPLSESFALIAPQHRAASHQMRNRDGMIFAGPDITSDDLLDAGERFLAELREAGACLTIGVNAILQSDVSPESIVKICDQLDRTPINEDLNTSKDLQLRQRALSFQRYNALVKLMKEDYDAYVATASFLSPSRIARRDLPNVQDIPYDKDADPSERTIMDSMDGPLVEDCTLPEMIYADSPLDKLLLSIFRQRVVVHTGGVTSERPAILGLVDQARTFMLQEGQTPEAQHKMVKDTLSDLMTPALPPFYRIFMSGIFNEKQFGPWFYAPFLTSVVTPVFFGFLVGPSYPNRRKDGERGGLVVEKCKFLQESGCKGICLHQCKIPAQEFFEDTLGLPLTVSPNFETQECQWSFGEKPLSPAEDPSFPQGCLVGCESRKAMKGRYGDICN